MSEGKKVVLISGANKGIGFETARQLGAKGFTVLMGARDLAKGEQAAAELKQEGIDARAVKLDVVSAADIEAITREIEREFGKLDVLVNNAGVMLEDMSLANTTMQTERATLRETFETNFFAVVALTQALLPLIRKSDAGRIVNLSSILGSLTLHATPNGLGAKTFAYDASKAALNSYTIHLAHALAETKIKVNSAHPGWVKTAMGGPDAKIEIDEGAKTSVDLATLADDGPTGGYFHLGNSIPW